MTDLEELAQNAINASISNQLTLAVKINTQILSIDKSNQAALNRLGKCFLLLKNYDKAKKYYQEALNNDPYNSVARKNLKLLKKSKNGEGERPDKKTENDTPLCYEFLEIAGKTQSIFLNKLADSNKICCLKTGQVVQLVAKKRSIRVYADNCYIGVIPDDLSRRLLGLIKTGNHYQAYVKSIQNNKVSIFIKELFQSKSNKNYTSFPVLNHADYETSISAGLFN